MKIETDIADKVSDFKFKIHEKIILSITKHLIQS